MFTESLGTYKFVVTISTLDELCRSDYFDQKLLPTLEKACRPYAFQTVLSTSTMIRPYTTDLLPKLHTIGTHLTVPRKQRHLHHPAANETWNLRLTIPVLQYLGQFIISKPLATPANEPINARTACTYLHTTNNTWGVELRPAFKIIITRSTL